MCCQKWLDRQHKYVQYGLYGLMMTLLCALVMEMGITGMFSERTIQFSNVYSGYCNVSTVYNQCKSCGGSDPSHMQLEKVHCDIITSPTIRRHLNMPYIDEVLVPRALHHQNKSIHHPILFVVGTTNISRISVLWQSTTVPDTLTAVTYLSTIKLTIATFGMFFGTCSTLGFVTMVLWNLLMYCAMRCKQKASPASDPDLKKKHTNIHAEDGGKDGNSETVTEMTPFYSPDSDVAHES